MVGLTLGLSSLRALLHCPARRRRASARAMRAQDEETEMEVEKEKEKEKEEEIEEEEMKVSKAKKEMEDEEAEEADRDTDLESHADHHKESPLPGDDDEEDENAYQSSFGLSLPGSSAASSPALPPSFVPVGGEEVPDLHVDNCQEETPVKTEEPSAGALSQEGALSQNPKANDEDKDRAKSSQEDDSPTNTALTPFIQSIIHGAPESVADGIPEQERARRILALLRVCERLAKLAPNQRPVSLKAFENLTRGPRTVRTFTADVEAILSCLPKEDLASFKADTLLRDIRARCTFGAKHNVEIPSPEFCACVARWWQAQRAPVLRQGQKAVVHWIQAMCYIEKVYTVEDVLSALRYFKFLRGPHDYGQGLRENAAFKLPTIGLLPLTPGLLKPSKHVLLCYSIHVPPGLISEFMGRGGSGIKATHLELSTQLSMVTAIPSEVRLKVNATRLPSGKMLRAQSATIDVSVRVPLAMLTRLEQAEELRPVDRRARELVGKIQSDLNKQYFARRSDTNAAKVAAQEEGRLYHKEREAARQSKKAAKKDRVQRLLSSISIPSPEEPPQRMSLALCKATQVDADFAKHRVKSFKQQSIQNFERRAARRARDRREALQRAYACLPKASPVDGSLQGLLDTAGLAQDDQTSTRATPFAPGTRRLLEQLRNARRVAGEAAEERLEEELERVEKTQFVPRPKPRRQDRVAARANKRRSLLEVDYEPTAWDF